MEDSIYQMDGDDFFKRYYVIGYDEIVHKFKGEFFVVRDAVKHLI